MSGPMRIAEGGQVDRETVLHFRFNGRPYAGLAGDTLASALLANGVGLVGRSFKYHRPRGVVSAGAEETNAIVQLETGPRTQPNLRATQIELYDGLAATSVNAWPSLGFDIGAANDVLSRFLPAGFYYKTFMWPRGAWRLYEHFIRKAAGLGRAPASPDPDRYERAHVHADVLVVGGGPAGLAAALAAGRMGARVVLAEQDAAWGGALLGSRDSIGDRPALDWVAGTLDTLAKSDDVRLLSRTTISGYYDHNFLLGAERVTDHLGPEAPDHLPRQRLWHIRAKQVVLATGAIERPLVFRNNDRPGIMLASAAQTYVNRFAVRPGRTAVVATNNDGAYRAARELAAGGVEVAAIVDLRHEVDDALVRETQEAGIEVLIGHGISDSIGRNRVTGVEVMRLAPDGGGVAGAPRRIACDMVATSGGWSPTVHLFSQSRGRLRYDEELAAFVPGESVQAERSAGAANGAFALDAALHEGFDAGKAAARAAGRTKSVRTARYSVEAAPAARPHALWAVPSRHDTDGGAKHFIDQANDVTVADVALAAREGYSSVEHTKRYTTLGMGIDQGKLSNVTGLAVLAGALESPIPAVGTTTFRPPYTPVAFGVIAGRDVGTLADPVRKTPMHKWHEDFGAVFEDVGQWKRPYCFPKPGESRARAVSRECRATRNAIGIMDATTLGKIDIQGPDAAELLNWVYTNAWNKLEIGRCRYGLMCGEDGMVFDDGVTSRLGEQRYLMTTTTGNAGHVLGWLEEWVQTEWPDMKVRMTSVTEQYATVTVAGPKSRLLLEELSEDIDLSAEAFPFLSWRDGVVAGIAARIFRISFTGELSFEVNVPASYGMALWTALMTAGEKYGITPFGTEAMHVLRAEKGFIIVGQETDGSVTPIDLGMDWIVSKKKKDFLGRRSLARPAIVASDRKQLVGLLTDNPNVVLPEGGQIVNDPEESPPMTMIGHVTSSYFSDAVGRSIALALVRGGRDRRGETVYVPGEDRATAAVIGDPVFYDPEGKRLHG